MSAVLPSYLESAPYNEGGAGALNDISLRLGEVVEAYAPNAPTNKNPATKNKQWVYVVNVTFRDGSGPRQVVPYRCTVSDMFGSLADHFRYTTRRTDTGNGGKFSRGANVLVLCANGDKSNAFIVGAVRNVSDLSPDPSETFLDFAFNGVNVHIDKDGALTIQVPGATKLDGKPDDNRDSNNKGSSVTFAKDGVITVDDNNGDSVTIEPASNTVTVKATNVNVVADTVTVKASKVNLGDEELALNPLDGVVIGSGIDSFTGIPYAGLGNTSLMVKAKKQ